MNCHTPRSISQMPFHSHLWRHLPPCGSLQARTALLNRLQICEPVAANLCRAGAWMYWPGKRIQVGYQLHLLQCSRNSFWECENDSTVLFMLRIYFSLVNQMANFLHTQKEKLDSVTSNWLRLSAITRSSLFPNSFFGGNSRVASWNTYFIRDRLISYLWSLGHY